MRGGVLLALAAVTLACVAPARTAVAAVTPIQLAAAATALSVAPVRAASAGVTPHQPGQAAVTQAELAPERQRPASQAAASHLVVVVGLGGDEERRVRFHGWAVRLVDAARDRYGLAPEQVHYLGERPEMDPARITAKATRDNLAATLARVGSVAGPSDDVILVLLGHGSTRGAEVRFNLPGPDLTPADLAVMLEPIRARRLAVVNTTSASGGFLADLAGEGRTVVVATRSAREQNETVFGGYFVEALAGDEADLDKDGRVSILEAFAYASRETRRSYEQEGLLLTEHALLDDDGDGEGVSDPNPPDTEGLYAAALFLSTGAPSEAATAATPELQALYQRRDSLQARVQDLRAVESTLAPDEYQQRLEDLLVEIGLLQREIRALEGGGQP